ncbi:MAG: GNAT family N-acetyltransferase [Ignavibacteriales bacterium]|nr:GNAT family N-acetyltransferase [Ignavibacteriales bacterium]
MTPTFKPLTEKTWNDFENLFGERGACGGCWCMSWRLKSSDFEKQKGIGNKKTMRGLVKKKEQIGIIAYIGKRPIGWCAVAPREKFIRLDNSRVLERVDNESVWSITCFFIIKEFRRKGLSTELLNGVINYCKKKKVKILEGYPTVPYNKNIPAAFAWTGIPISFERAGFKEVERRSKSRPIMRYYL